MKSVFTDLSTIAHMWANKVQDSARNSGSNFFFERNVIYSYGHHFPIAKHIVNDAGQAATLFTERSYSNTTAKHIRITAQAANHLNLIYCYNPESNHDQNLQSWKKEAEAVASNLKTARKPEKYLSEVGAIKHKVEKYSAFFSLSIPADVLAAVSVGNKDEYAAYVSKKQEYEAAAKAAEIAENKKRHKKELSKWLSGESYRMYIRDGHDYLRLNAENNRIETTQAVQIPFEVAHKLYELIKADDLQVGHKILDYSVDSIGKEIKIGCHNFEKKYLLSFGAKVFA